MRYHLGLQRPGSEQPRILRAFGLCLRGPLRLPEGLNLTSRRRTVARVMIVGIGENGRAAPCNLVADVYLRAQFCVPVVWPQKCTGKGALFPNPPPRNSGFGKLNLAMGLIYQTDPTKQSANEH